MGRQACTCVSAFHLTLILIPTPNTCGSSPCTCHVGKRELMTTRSASTNIRAHIHQDTISTRARASGVQEEPAMAEGSRACQGRRSVQGRHGDNCTERGQPTGRGAAQVSAQSGNMSPFVVYRLGVCVMELGKRQDSRKSTHKATSWSECPHTAQCHASRDLLNLGRRQRGIVIVKQWEMLTVNPCTHPSFRAHPTLAFS